MKKMKGILSIVLSLCILLSLVPAQVFAQERAGVSYVLDTDGIDVGATYVILRQNAWSQKIIALSGDGKAGDCSEAIQSISVTAIPYFEGVEALEWTVESYMGNAPENPISIVHKHMDNGTVTNRYLKLDSSGFSFSETQAPLSIRNNTYHILQSKGEYIIANKESESLYHYLAVSTSDFRYGSTTSLGGLSSGLRFYKKEAPYTVTFDGNGHTTNTTQKITHNGILPVLAEPALMAVERFEAALEEAKNAPVETPETVVDPFELQKEQTSQLFTAVRTWLDEEEGGVA